jgi:hypothetical protein
MTKRHSKLQWHMISIVNKLYQYPFISKHLLKHPTLLMYENIIIIIYVADLAHILSCNPVIHAVLVDEKSRHLVMIIAAFEGRCLGMNSIEKLDIALLMWRIYPGGR